MFLFNTEKAESTEVHRENRTIGERDGKRDLTWIIHTALRSPAKQKKTRKNNYKELTLNKVDN